VRQAAALASPPAQPPVLPVAPNTHAQCLALALGPEHLLLRFHTYDEYPTEEQARCGPRPSPPHLPAPSGDAHGAAIRSDQAPYFWPPHRSRTLGANGRGVDL
jgi:hypothetical protein